MKKDFFSCIQFGTDIIDDEHLVDIEMLRIGKFTHPKYGELDISEPFLDSLVTNFANNALKREISFDWNHAARDASAWLRGLTRIDDTLIGSVEFTKKGQKSVENGEYGYFSVEFLKDYKDPETDESFGPALAGGALTNRPFITNLKKIEFENSDFPGQVFQLEQKPSKKAVVRIPAAADTGDLDNEITSQLEKMVIQKTELEAQLEALKLKAEGSAKDTEQLSELVTLVRTLGTDNKTLAQKILHLEKTNAEAVVENRKLEIDAACRKFADEDGHHAGIIAVAREIMLASKPVEKVVTLSETVGEGDDAKTITNKLTMDEAIKSLLDAIPNSQRSDFSEKTTSLTRHQIDNESEDIGMKKAFAKKGIKLQAVA